VSRLLPLFPLDLVLLPGIPLPLHIFEPRYREMIAHCLESKEPFGVVRAQEQGFENVGCTAEILTVTKQYEDGRMDIVTQGRDRFEVMLLNEERSYLQAEVMLLTDDAAQATSEEIALAVKLHGEILTLAGAVPESVQDVEGTLVSFHLAGSLPLDLEFKQQLLAMKSEPERLRVLISYFESILPNLRRAVHVRRKAGGNGHGD
jgi:Lon protease-like protein